MINYVILALYILLAAFLQTAADEIMGVKIIGPRTGRIAHHAIHQLVGIGFVVVWYMFIYNAAGR